MSHEPRWTPVFAFVLGVGLAILAAAGPLESLVGSEARLMKAVNQVRRDRHLAPLAPHTELASVALAHARDMARNGYLNHVNLKGENPLQRVQAAGIGELRLLAENIGRSSEGDRLDAIVRQWLISHDHRENLLNPAFNRTGLAVVETSDGATLVVQLYATFED